MGCLELKANFSRSLEDGKGQINCIPSQPLQIIGDIHLRNKL